ncbi:MAG: alpha/beta hydrolase [Pseudomonadota bacterium]
MCPTSSDPDIRHFQTSDGLSLAYDDAGDGLPLLCLAGLTRNMTDFDFVRPHLLKQCRVIRLDSRGRGRSDFDKDYMNYNILRESEDVLELLDHLGIAQTAILGTSRGGMIAMVLGSGHPDRLLGACLNDIGPMIEPAGLAHIFGYLSVVPPQKTLDEAARAIQETYAAKFPTVDLARWRAHVDHIYKQGATGLELRYDAQLRKSLIEQSAGDTLPSMWPLFDAFKGLPIALIRGENSDILSAETKAEMVKRRPDMLHTTVPDRGHVPFLDEPEALDLLTQFIQRLEKH